MEEEIKNKKKQNKVNDAARDNIIIDHEYDGIKELDNEMPGWWRYLFYFSIVFAIGYLVRYHVLKTAPLQEEEYLVEMGLTGDEEDVIAPTFEETVELTLLEDQESLASGNNIFQKNCAVCHLQQGQGLVGPNLTDQYWIHGGGFNDIVRTITEGVPAKGMISWKNQLNTTQIQEVASFVASLQGTNPPNPKDPQGELYTPEEQ